jgi:hypothetical protein
MPPTTALPAHRLTLPTPTPTNLRPSRLPFPSTEASKLPLAQRKANLVSKKANKPSEEMAEDDE